VKKEKENLPESTKAERLTSKNIQGYTDEKFKKGQQKKYRRTD
jgi:hypothetical protein